MSKEISGFQKQEEKVNKILLSALTYKEWYRQILEKLIDSGN